MVTKGWWWQAWYPDQPEEADEADDESEDEGVWCCVHMHVLRLRV